MMDKYASQSNLSPLLRKIFALLVELNDSRQAAVFRNHIMQSLVELEANQEKTIETYVGLIDLLLDTIAAQLPPDSLALSHLKLIKTCLTPPLTDAELSALHQNVAETADILKNSTLINVDELNNSVMPVLQRVAGVPEPEEEHAHFPQPTSKEAKKGFEESSSYYSDDSYAGYDETASDVNAEFAEEEIPELEEPVQTRTAEKNFTKPKLVDSLNHGFDEKYDARRSRSRSADHDLEKENDIENYHLVEEEFDQLQSFSDQDIFENVKTANIGSRHDREENKPLKAPKAVLKMLRFPDQSKLSSENSVESHEELGEGTGETDSLLDDFPMYDDFEDETADTDTLVTSEESNDDSYTSDEMESLHRDFIKQLREVVAENTEFGVHLGLEIDALDAASKINQIEDRKKMILASMKKISESHTDLAKKFDAAQNYLSIIESDKRKLSDELNRARMLSLTDELTSLPNRRAFIRRLDDEVSRVKRYGFPLSLVLIDIDNFKHVNDEYGHTAGDQVLRIYADKILSIFRHHDMIARYGGEEFAVLLPNTDLKGVLRALDKVKSSVPTVQCNFNGLIIQAPTFSAGVAEYRAPESPSQLIERADHALYRAKRMGRNRIEVEKKSSSHDTADQT